MSGALAGGGVPLISVLVPAWNDEPYLETCLGSLERQTMGDFEAIVSDDASRDATAAIAAAIAGRDSRFRLVRNPANLGMTRNWNSALRHARGRFVVKLDGDDAFSPQTLEVLAAEATAAGSGPMACCRTLCCDDALAPQEPFPGDAALARSGLDPLRRHCLPGRRWYALCFDDAQLWHSDALLLEREFLRALGGWDETWGCAADTDVILRVLESGANVTHLPHAGVLYRRRRHSVSDTYRSHDWLLWESVLLHLASLSRAGRADRRLAWRLRRQWWRTWRTWQRMRASGPAALASLEAGRRDALLQAGERLEPPPGFIRIDGRLREALRRLRGRD